MQDSRKPLYEALIDSKYKILKEISTLDPINGWEFSKEKNNVVIHTKKDPKTGLNIVRAESLVDVIASDLAEQITKIGEYPLWDKTLEEAKCIENIEGYIVAYAKVRKIPAITIRESLSVNKVFYQPDNSIIGVGCSIEHPACPITKHSIRVEICLMGWIMIPDPISNQKTRVIYIFQIDPKGWVPKSLYNAFCFVQGQNVNKICRYITNKTNQNENESEDRDKDKENNPENQHLKRMSDEKLKDQPTQPNGINKEEKSQNSPLKKALINKDIQ